MYILTPSHLSSLDQNLPLWDINSYVLWDLHLAFPDRPWEQHSLHRYLQPICRHRSSSLSVGASYRGFSITGRWKLRVLFRSSIFILIFCLLVLSITEREMLTSLTILVDFSISLSFFCAMHLKLYNYCTQVLYCHIFLINWSLFCY